MSKAREAATAMRQLIALHHKQIDCMEKLVRMMELADFLKLEPKDIKSYSMATLDPGGAFEPWRRATVRITVNGEATEHKVIDLPVSMWPEGMQEVYSRVKTRRKMQGGTL